MRVGAPEAEAEVEVRVDFFVDGFITIGPECVLRVYKDVHLAPPYAAPRPPPSRLPRRSHAKADRAAEVSTANHTNHANRV